MSRAFCHYSTAKEPADVQLESERSRVYGAQRGLPSAVGVWQRTPIEHTYPCPTSRLGAHKLLKLDPFGTLVGFNRQNGELRSVGKC